MPHKKVSGFSLKTQIYGLVIFLGLISFIGSLLISLEHTKDYLNEQMGSHAQDTATSLGLSISPYLDDDNILIAETMVSAIFDSGYYAAMVLTANNGEIILQRENPNSVDTVPNWFIDLFSLNPPARSSEINNGWQIVGKLTVTSHAGVSYYQLWQYGTKASVAFLVILIISLIIAYLILSAVLKPLVMVEQQATSVANKQFVLNPKKPFTRELKLVVNALNTMVKNVQKNFDAMTRQAEKITKEAYLDKLTGLGNRRAFESQFSTNLSEIVDDETATLALVELPSLQKVNTEFGYQAGDKYVLNVVKLLQDNLIQLTDTKIYRLNGGSFIISIAQSLSLCKQEMQAIEKAFDTMSSDTYTKGFAKLVAIAYKHSDPLNKLLKDLDTLITQESSALSNNKSIYAENDGLSLGSQEWKSLIEDLIDSGRIEFLYQPVKTLDTNQVLYNELLAKFYFNDKIIPNNQLFAMAERLNLTEQLDKKLISAASLLISHETKQPYAINLSKQSLLSDTFHFWLTEFMQNNPQCNNNIYFEINETALLKNIELATTNINVFKSLDVGLCIERFGTSFTSFKYLRGLNLDYIKLDGSYVRDLINHTDNNYFIQAVNQICRSLGIKVIACHIENKQIFDLISELECDACQGQFIQQPKNLI